MINNFNECNTNKEIYEILKQIKNQSIKQYHSFNTETLSQMYNKGLFTQEMFNQIVNAYNAIHSLDLHKLATAIGKANGLKKSSDITKSEEQFMKSKASEFNLSAHNIHSIFSINKNITLLPNIKINRVIVCSTIRYDEDGIWAFAYLAFYVNGNLIKKVFPVINSNTDGCLNEDNNINEAFEDLIDEIDYCYNGEGCDDYAMEYLNRNDYSIIADKLIYELLNNGAFNQLAK